ncbi:hypothetical protein [Streptosporangium vulgare]|uniref:hypothetical protein n=1 Tax=Streptosporangium vulgare TaxID=46190 RepID=UPI003CD0BB13
MSPHWRSRRTAKPWPAAAATEGCGCGTASAGKQPSSPAHGRLRGVHAGRRTLAAGGDDGRVRLLDVAAAGNSPRSPATKDYVDSVAFTPDGQTLASGSYDDGGGYGTWPAAGK